LKVFAASWNSSSDFAISTWSQIRLLNTKCVFWFSLQLLLRRTQWDVIKNVYWPSSKVPPLFLSDLNEILIFSQVFSKNS
jgi:hypothetical protein